MKQLFSIFLCCLTSLLCAQNKTIALLEPRIGEGSTEISGMEKAMVRGELRKAIVNIRSVAMKPLPAKTSTK